MARVAADRNTQHRGQAVRMAVRGIGPGPWVVLQPLAGAGEPVRLQVAEVFGLRGPFCEALLLDLLDDVSQVWVVRRHRLPDGRWCVDLLPDPTAPDPTPPRSPTPGPRVGVRQARR